MGELLTHRHFTVVSSSALQVAGFDQEVMQSPLLQQKIKRCLDISTEMVSAAFWALLNFDSAWRMNPDGLSRDNDAIVVIPALVKYFRVDSDIAQGRSRDKHLTMVDRIRSVYASINTGLSLRSCKILIDDTGTANGRVAQEQVLRRPANGQISPIRRNFGFTTEWNHRPWQRSIGDIEMNVSYIRGGTPDAIARTIVHEASHKFAQTKDVMYKHESFAKLLAGSDLTDTIDLGFQPEVNLPGRAKRLLPMAGFEKRAPDQTISAEHLLENADSYAWAARRIWKHKTGFRKAA